MPDTNGALPTPPDPAQTAKLLRDLGNELDSRQSKMRQYKAYYDGEHPMIYASRKFRDAFGSFLSGYSDNFCETVVDAVEERLDVEGFRFGGKPEDDADAWRIWQRNAMDAKSQLVHQEALVKGASYVIVWTDPDDCDTPRITVEDALQVAVQHDPGSGKRVAGLKRWDDEDATYATLYLPDRIEKYVRAKRRTTGSDSEAATGFAGFIPRIVPGEPWPLPNPMGIVPVVPFVNRADLKGSPKSEIKNVIPVQNAINKLGIDMLVASEFAAFRQRWVTGFDVPIDPDTQKPIEPFKAAVDRLFIAEDPQAKFGTFDVTDLTNYKNAIDMWVQHVAMQTRTPQHYLMGAGAQGFPSGESLKTAETGLVAKARRKMRYWGEGWEEVIRLAFLALGDEVRGDDRDTETIWRNPESKNEAVLADMAVKYGSAPIGLPQEMLWELIGLSPKQIARAKALLKEKEAEAEKKAAEQAANEPPEQPGDEPQGDGMPMMQPGARPGPPPMPPAMGGGHNGAPIKAMTGAPEARPA